MTDRNSPVDPPPIGQADAAATHPAPSGHRDIPYCLRLTLERQMLGTRLSTLAQGMVELLDRTLAERAGDSLRWAAEPVVLDCLSGPTALDAARRLKRLIADRTIYLDLWIADAEGTIVATGRPDRHPGLIGADISDQPWFGAAMTSPDGTYIVADIAADPRLGGKTSLPFAAAIRGPDPAAAPHGVIVLHFDWHTQSSLLIHHARLRSGNIGSRCLLLDRMHRVIADTDDRSDEAQTFPLVPDSVGWFVDGHGILIGHARSSGHQNFSGLGWHGVIARRPSGDEALH